MSRITPAINVCRRRSFGAIPLVLALILPTAALSEDAKMNHTKLSLNTLPGEITVTSSDGEEWDTILPGTVNLRADIDVDTKYPGYVQRAGIYLGSCANSAENKEFCKNAPRILYAEPYVRDWKTNGVVEFDISRIEESVKTSHYKDQILGQCNKGLTADGASRTHQTTATLVATLSVNTRKGNPNRILREPADPFAAFDGGDASAATYFTVRLNCEAFSMIKAPPEPVSVDLKVKQIGETCPNRTEVTAILKYNVATQARFRFKHNGEYSRIFKPKTVKGRPVASPGPRGRHVAERTKVYHLDPGQHRFRIETESGKKSRVVTIRTKCPPFKVTSVWLKYKVENKLVCKKNVRETTTARATRPGTAPFEIKTQGGLVVHSGKLNFVRKGMKYEAKFVRPKLMMGAFDSDMMANITNDDANSGWTRLTIECLEVLSGTLDLRAFAPNQCRGEAALTIRTNMAQKVPYRVDCTGGRSWTKKVTARQTGPDTYIGVAVLPFSVINNEHVNCALKTRKPLPIKVLALKGRKYKCHKKNIETGADSITTSSPKKPKAPQRVLVPKKPKCKTKLKKVCTRKPVRKCRKVAEKQCKRVPKQTCTDSVKKVCKPVKKRVCRKIGSTNRKVCEVKIKQKCKRKKVRKCKRTWVKKCTRTFKNKCETKMISQCKTKRDVICTR